MSNKLEPSLNLASP